MPKDLKNNAIERLKCRFARRGRCLNPPSFGSYSLPEFGQGKLGSVNKVGRSFPSLQLRATEKPIHCFLSFSKIFFINDIFEDFCCFIRCKYLGTLILSIVNGQENKFSLDTFIVSVFYKMI